jgi:predicted dehydrogenase
MARLVTGDRVRCALVGYGPTFNFGWMHATWMRAVPELELVAICDRDPERAAVARADFPAVEVVTELDALLARDDVDLVSVVTPHNTHAPLVLACLQAGKHTVVEKPMCLSIAEATAMTEAAQAADRTLTVFHNRRHDGNVRAIREVIEEGRLGEVFHLELSACGRGRPGDTWRSQKEVSGGLLYDWGSHAIDWVLSLVPGRMREITGFFHKLLWQEVSNEEQTQAIILFENGAVADIQQSSLAYVGKPLWRILGTKGGIIDTGAGAIDGYCRELTGPSGGRFTLVTDEGATEVPYKESDWVTYYFDLADHLLRGAPVPVSGEDGRRVITVLETAEKSARSGRSEPAPYP